MGKMFWHFAKYWATGQIRFEDGFALFGGVRMLFLSYTIIATIQKALQEEFGEREGSYLAYKLFREGGKTIPGDLLENIGIHGFEVIRFMIDMATGSGWGKLKLVDYNDREQRAIISIEKSPFPLSFNPVNPVCHTTRGLIAGTLSTIFNEEIEGVERECSIKNCLMLFQSRDEWLKVRKEDLRKKVERQLPHLFE